MTAPRPLVTDAPRALAFLVSQQSFIEPTVYRTLYPSIRYPRLVPVDTDAPEWVSTVTYYSVDRVGQAAWIHAQAGDVPRAEVLRRQYETTVAMAGIGYGYDLEELGKAQLMGMNLSADKADAARRASEEFIDQVVLAGDAAKGFSGLLNNPAVTTGTAAAAGTGSSTAWAQKSADQILADINGQLVGIFTGSANVEMADTLLLPYDQMLSIGLRRIDPTSPVTILEWIRGHNVYTLETGQELTVFGVRSLESAGTGGSARMVAYRRDPSVLKLWLPMPFRFFSAWQTGPWRFEVPGAFRLGGLDIRRPGAFRYLDGI
ncbi:MAG: DUF2184 domain-containing protein [Methylobacterium frigidaeris]